MGWVDGTARGGGLGRGQIHRAHYLPPGADPRPAHTLSLDYQDLPSRLIGLAPQALLPGLMRLGANPLGVTLVNSAKYLAARAQNHHHYRQSLVAFNFLLELPAVNARFVTLMPYAATLFSKALFGLAMGCYATQRLKSMQRCPNPQ